MGLHGANQPDRDGRPRLRIKGNKQIILTMKRNGELQQERSMNTSVIDEVADRFKHRAMGIVLEAMAAAPEWRARMALNLPRLLDQLVREIAAEIQKKIASNPNERS